MDRAEAIGRLPSTYAAIIELLDEGAGEELIAERLDVELDTVQPLVTLARAKLARILATPATEGDGDGDGDPGSDAESGEVPATDVEVL
jgi:DNA-directed RNA polymerase specialized sigma24 family protein